MSLTLGNGIAIQVVGDKTISLLEHGKKWKVSQTIEISEVLLRNDEDGRKVEFTFEIEVTKFRKPILGMPFLPFGPTEYSIEFLNVEKLYKLREEMGWVDMGSDATFGFTMPEIINNIVGEMLRQVGEISD